jgi:hypothetical protein
MVQGMNSTMVYCKTFCKCHNVTENCKGGMNYCEVISAKENICSHNLKFLDIKIGWKIK